MADFEIRFTSVNYQAVDKEIQSLETILKKTQKQVSALAEAFGVSADGSDNLSKKVKAASDSVNTTNQSINNLSESVESAAKFTEQFQQKLGTLDAPLTELGKDLQAAANEAINLREDLSKIGNNTESLESVAESVGKSSLALETLSNKLNTSNTETKKVISSVIEFSQKLELVAQSSDKSSQEVLDLVELFKKGNLTLVDFAKQLNTTEDSALQLAAELNQDADIIDGFAKKLNLSKDELVQTVTAIETGTKSFGELLDILDKTDTELADFINSFDGAELSIKSIALATQLSEDEVRKLIDEIRQGDKAVKDFAQAMNLSEAEVLALTKSYIDLQYGSTELVKSTQSLASSYNVVKESLSPVKKAIDDVTDAIDQTSKNIDKLSDGTEVSAQTIQDNFGLIEEKAEQLLDVLVEFGTGAVSAFAEFDSALRQSAVVGGLTEGDVKKLTQAVIQLGVETSASPTQVAEMTSALSRAGFTAQEQIDSLEGMIRAAEATGEEFSVLSNVIGNTVRTFGLAASESDTVGDILVSAANNTNTSIGALGEAFAYAGTQAVQSNQSVADIAITLGLLADTGLEGSAGGTALAEALRRLSLASAGANSEFANLIRGNEKMIGAFSTLGVQIRDTNGNLLPLTEILPIIKNSLDQLASQEDKEIVANALFGVQGARGFLSLMDQVDTRLQTVSIAVKNSGGVAKEAGAEILDGISGSLDIFASTVDTFSIKLGEFLSIAVEPVVQGATALLNGFLQLNPTIQQLVFGVGTLGAAFTAAVTVITVYNTLQVQATLAALADTAAKLKLAAANFSVSGSLGALDVALANSIKAMYGATATATATAGAVGTAGAAAGGAAVGFGGLIAVLQGAFGVLTKLSALLGPVIAAIASIQLAVASFDASTKAGKAADESVQDLIQSYNTYAETIGAAAIQTEKATGIFNGLFSSFDSLKNGIKSAVDAIREAAYNFNIADFLPPSLERLIELLPGIDGIVSAAEADMSRLSTASGDLNVVLNSLNTAFVNFKVSGELGSDAAQGLVIQIQRAKDAITAMQEAAIANGNATDDQIFAFALQQQQLSSMLNELNAAKIETDNLTQAQSESVDMTELMAQKLKELADGLASAMQGIDAEVLAATVEINKKYIDNAEQREAAISAIESQALNKRILTVEDFLNQRKALTGLDAEQEIENQEEIANLEIELLNLRVEQTENAIALREEAEKIYREKQEALAQNAYEKNKLRLNQETADLNTALDERIAAENAAIESLNDRTDSINQELELTRLLGEQTNLIYTSRQQALDAQIASIGLHNQAIDQQIEKLRQAGGTQEQINALEQLKIANQNTLIGLEEQKRKLAEKQLLAQQAQERQELAFQQELQRLDLDRQVRQSQINALESEREVLQARQVIKSNELELSEKRRLLNLAKINGATEAELISLQSEVEGAQAVLNLSNQSLTLAQQSANLAKEEVVDAQNLRAGFEDIATVQTKNLELSQENELAQLRNTQEAERTTAELNRGGQAAAQTANNLDSATNSANGLAGAAGGAASETDRLAESAAQVARNYFSAVDALKQLNAAESVSRDNLGNVTGDKYSAAREAVKQFSPLKTVRTSGGENAGTKYFIGDKEVSLQEYNDEIAARARIQDLAKVTVRGQISGFVAGEGASREELEASIKSIENLKRNTEAFVRKMPGVSLFWTSQRDQDILDKLNKQLQDLIAQEEEAERVRKFNHEQELLRIAAETEARRQQFESLKEFELSSKDFRVSLSRQTQLEIQSIENESAEERLNLDRLRQEKLLATAEAAQDAIEVKIKESEKRILDLRIQNANKVKDLLESLGVSVQTESRTATIPGRAAGGPVSAQKPYIVGENGPELFVPKSNGSIIPNRPTLGSLALERPQTALPSIASGGLSFASLAAEIKGLRADLNARPVPKIDGNFTFVNEPNPLAAQLQVLQNQLRAARAV